MRILPLKEIPFVEEGDDLPELILQSAEFQGVPVEDEDVFVIAQTVVSKSEGNVIKLDNIEPSERARELSSKMEEPPSKMEVILRETEEILRMDHVLIALTKHGFVCANAGVDASNVEAGYVTVLPEKPDKSAERIRERIEEATDAKVAVIISDSWGRPFRLGAVGFAIGLAGMKALNCLKGKKDAYGNELKTTVTAPPDSIAAAGSLVMGESDEKTPGVIIKDVPFELGEGSADELLRPPESDLFR